MKNEENKVVLNEQLQSALDLVGTTPFDEPEIFKAIDSEHPQKAKAVKLALSRKGLDMNLFKATDIAEFYNAMRNKIMALKLEDGTYKSTKATESYKFPNYEEVDYMGELSAKLNRLYNKRVSDKKDKKLDEEIAQCFLDIDAHLWKITGLNKDDLTPWEISLVSEQIFNFVTEVENTSMGKPLSI